VEFADERIPWALQTIHAAQDRPWTVADLACVAGLSRTAFSNRFHELLDHTPFGYMTDWRMQLAQRLLIDSDLSITAVAERSGYQSEPAFGRVFKKNFETPPASFRRSRDDARLVQ